MAYVFFSKIVASKFTIVSVWYFASMCLYFISVFPFLEKIVLEMNAYTFGISKIDIQLSAKQTAHLLNKHYVNEVTLRAKLTLKTLPVS